ncbi:MAG: type II toxin-antitoxin system PemK/MazF family toxin [Clostridiaceae bacterium]|jgi:mRNA interferase MazF|nr:type II toxin-antitoxin system PemK/MazF family toxin [Clostridiaceae bacterium]
MNQRFRDFYRGEVYYAYLEPSFGHEQGGTRPVLILQNDIGNYYSPTLIVTVATTRKRRKLNMPTHVELSDIEGLPDVSVFMLEVLRTIDKRRIRSYAGKLTKEQMDQIDAALRISLRLDEDAWMSTEVEAP